MMHHHQSERSVTWLLPAQLFTHCYRWWQEQYFFYQHLAISQFELDDDR
jgi:hypothetical protein